MMSYCSIFNQQLIHIPKALPSLCLSHRSTPLSITYSKHNTHSSITKPKMNMIVANILHKPIDNLHRKQFSLAIQVGALLTSFGQPALAVTGVNDEEDFTLVLIQLGIVAVFYFLLMPPIIMNWLRTRWYKRNFFEMYFQFMFVFLFFPGVLVWAPFLNFRKFPRDPSLKYPWSKPENPDQIRNSFPKYPFAKPEDYS